MHFSKQVEQLAGTHELPAALASTLHKFYHSFMAAARENRADAEETEQLLCQFLVLVVKQLKTPFQFSNIHQRVTSPFDYYRFGLDFLKPIVKLDKSSVMGRENVAAISAKLAKGDNVILFANHQTEPDPQLISLLLEKTDPRLAEEMYFVAGHRVTTDPLAVPFSMGRNLVCIYSKNYIENPPEQKAHKVAHNQNTMKRMRALLAEGGKCIYVAPSGGRDRPNAKGVVEIAKFDPQSIEMFWFTARHSGVETHFYPLAMQTYKVLPPPDQIKLELGEERRTESCPVHLNFGKSLDMSHFPGSTSEDKKERRTARAIEIQRVVTELYREIPI